jgi:hypothetical protein
MGRSIGYNNNYPPNEARARGGGECHYYRTGYPETVRTSGSARWRKSALSLSLSWELCLCLIKTVFSVSCNCGSEQHYLFLLWIQADV